MKVQPVVAKLKNGLSVLLRSVESADAKDMLNHLITTHSESYRNMNQTVDFWLSFPPEQEEKILADFAQSESKFMIVAIYDNRIVGGMGCVGAQGQFHKKNLTLGMSIQNSFSNIGLGTAMMRLAIEIARNSGFHRIDLTVRSFNKSGIALYEKIGFKRVGSFRDIAFIDGEFHDEYAYEFILN